MILPILAYGHPILRKKCKSIDKNSKEIKSLISNMWETMYNAEGVGLAAPQVGVNKKIFIIDANPLFPNDQEISDFEKLNSKKVFINPEITEMDGEQCYYRPDNLGAFGQYAYVSNDKCDCECVRYYEGD